jgi:hypothetical protein
MSSPDNADGCPQCGFSYAWDGARCTHCRYGSPPDEAPKEPPAAETPVLVPRETPTGVRYVRSPGAPRRHRPILAKHFLVLLVILSTALVVTGIVLVNEGQALAGWELALALLYPLQLALDLVGVARLSWPSLKSWPGDLEVELSGDRLREGLRCGPLWTGSQTIFVAQVKRLVVVKRREQKCIIWELVAERDDGSRMVIIGADDPVHVISLARDLHARLAQRQELRDRWPPLAEEDRTDEAEPDRPLPPPLLPGGAWTWLAVHVIGVAGLAQIGTLLLGKAPRPVWHMFVFVLLGILQALILVGNFGMLMASLSGGKTKP